MQPSESNTIIVLIICFNMTEIEYNLTICLVSDFVARITFIINLGAWALFTPFRYSNTLCYKLSEGRLVVVGIATNFGSFCVFLVYLFITNPKFIPIRVLNINTFSFYFHAILNLHNTKQLKHAKALIKSLKFKIMHALTLDWKEMFF